MKLIKYISYRYICASKPIPKETLLMIGAYQEMHHVLSPIKFQQKVLE